MAVATAAQTIGPFWHLIEHAEFADLTRFGVEGERVVLTGRIVDGDKAPIADACVEIWQASPEASAVFPGYGRARTDADGVYRFLTVKPAPVPGLGNALQAPHFAVNILARGILTRLVTRAYFAGEALNEADPVLALVPEGRRGTMMARASGGEWRFDIVLQGEGETVFLDV